MADDLVLTPGLSPRDLVFQEVVRLLGEKLPANLTDFKTISNPGSNWMQIVYNEFPRSVYELRQGKKVDYIGFYIGGGQGYYQEYYNKIVPMIDSISQIFGYPLKLLPVREKWLGMFLELPKGFSKQLDFYFQSIWPNLIEYLSDPTDKTRLEFWEFVDETKLILDETELAVREKGEVDSAIPRAQLEAHMYVHFFSKFIQSSYYPLINVFQSIYKPPIRRTINHGRSANEKAYRRLDKIILEIRKFIDGGIAYRPSDEQLCDWVQFCYLFELYPEGSELFRYVEQTKVDPWQYRRTKKYAQVCHAKTRSS